MSQSDAERESPAFETGIERLEEIVQKLERGDSSLEESLRLYEEGVRLHRQCHEQLAAAEGKIEQLLKDARGEIAKRRDGAPRAKALDADGD